LSALSSDAPGESLSGALELVDSILAAARADGAVARATRGRLDRSIVKRRHGHDQRCRAAQAR
jgi:uncharacterized membrane protein YebE (DUF533 family)